MNMSKTTLEIFLETEMHIYRQHIEEVLQNQNRTLQNQNLRISSIENQISEMNKFKSNTLGKTSNRSL